ncbi:MAG: tRNA (adenosine(37)-N6)-threonylcarbamoyltransferase complex dimerization subunit type 1 TsaB [Treponema sp.]|nr:tRNA (adenosine(37)-N6)-threonylcarbamoyltransferase complex dimerization subunit type 1 TsaB [Treponema sp.]
MNALGIDTSGTAFTVAVKKDTATIITRYDIGMKQSEMLVPAIDAALSQLQIPPPSLDYIALAAGPGSFTGLRLAFAAAKALSLAHRIPVYAVPTLELYAFPYRRMSRAVAPIIDAKKETWYAALFDGQKSLLPQGDYTTVALVDAFTKTEKPIFLCGPDAGAFFEKPVIASLAEKIRCVATEPAPATALFALAEEQITAATPALSPYDGPLYIRLSEAEEKRRANG